MAVLAQGFCARNDARGDPFTPLSVIVQNHELGRWLKFSLAQEHGISANVDCRFLAAFLWQLYRQLPTIQAPGESPFDSARLVWRIMALLQKQKINDRALRNYLAQPGDASLRHYQLSYEIAELFNQYLVYRPEWTLQWAGGGNDPARTGHRWQPELWRALLEDLGERGELHRAALHQVLLAQLQAGEYPVQTLPCRISVFGLSSMPAMQIQTLQALAQHVEVDIYFLNPCRHYWGDIVSDKDQARRSIRALRGDVAELTEDDYLEAGNPILASLGKQGREYFEMLLDIPLLQSEEQFVEHADSSALSLVKNDILELTFGGEFGNGATPEPRPMPDQDSLQIHACHSRLREVEVLYDELLRLMDDRKDLLPGQVLVMAPDIAQYTPFIHSVFDDGIPFNVSGRAVLDESPLSNGFLTLLKLPESRFTGSEVIELLDMPAIARRYGLLAEDIRRITLWVRDTGIRWELDGASKQKNWQVPVQRHNTWEFGLDRLLLGFAMTDEQTWNGILPFEVAVEDARLIAGLAHFVELLDGYRDQLSKPRSPSAWQALLSRLLTDFFLPADAEMPELDRLQGLVGEFGAVTRAGGCEKDLSYALVHHWMQEQLGGATSRSRTPSGGVRFASLSTLRGIPGRVIGLLGLNDGEYPRETQPHSFDLASPGNDGYRKGDRSLRQDDRYLFLEALLSAEEVFYLSYVGRGVRDDKEKPASVVVTEWLRYLQALFGATGVKPIAHTLQPFSRRCYQGGRLQSRQPLWYEARANTGPRPVFCREPLPEDPALACHSLDQLERFLTHSGKYFLQQRLRVYLNDEEIELKDTETFSLDALERYGLADHALAQMVQGRTSMEAWQRRQLASGTVIGDATVWGQMKEAVALARAIYHSLKEETGGAEQCIQSGVIRLKDTTIQYQLKDVYGRTHLYYRAGRLKEKHQLSAWLRHLVLNAGDRRLRTTMVTKKDRKNAIIHQFKPLDAREAREHLEGLLALYRLGTTSPLLLPPETSLVYYMTLSAGGDVHEAKRAAVNAWLRKYGEGEDAYWSRLFSLPEDLDTEAQAEAFYDHATLLWRSLKGRLVSAT